MTASFDKSHITSILVVHGTDGSCMYLAALPRY